MKIAVVAAGGKAGRKIGGRKRYQLRGLCNRYG